MLHALSQSAQLARLELKVRLTRRAMWAVLMRSGELHTEIEADWLDLPPKGRQAIRLYCPNGQVPELGSSSEMHGRMFQFKVAVASAGVGAGGRGGRETLAHVVGRIDAPDGGARCYAWEYGWPQAEMNPAPLMGVVRRLCIEERGYERVASAATIDPAVLRNAIAGAVRLSVREADRLVDAYGARHGFDRRDVRGWFGVAHLYGPFEDNAHRMAYGNAGALCPEHLGMVRA